MAVCFSLPSLSAPRAARDMAGRSRAALPARAAAPRAARSLRNLRVSAAAEEAAAREGSDPKTMSVNMPAVLDINEIMNRLPHRFPFLLVRFLGPPSCLRLTRLPQVDRVVEYVPGKYAIGIKCVTVRLGLEQSGSRLSPFLICCNGHFLTASSC